MVKGETLRHKLSSNYPSRRSDCLRAFTLIELLVTLAIILLLAAVLFPVFSRAKIAAYKTKDLAHLKQIGLGQLIYTEDFDNHYLSFPRAGSFTTPAYSNGEKGPFWSDRQMPYVKSQEIYSGPTNDDPVYEIQGYLNAGTDTPGQSPLYRVTYALNPAMTRAFKNPDVPGASSSVNVEHPADTVLATASQSAWPFSACVEDSPGSGVTHLAWMVSDPNWGYELFGKKGLQGGFDGGLNFTYADGHAKFHRVSDQGTHPGDLYPYKGRDLFQGVFPKAIIKKDVATDGTCPINRGEVVF